MIRNFAPLAAVFALATAAHAQTGTYSRTYTTTDGRGNSTTTTIEAPATPAGVSAVGLIANQTVYGGFPSYAGGVPSYGANCPPVYGGGYAGYPTPTYGYPVPTYGYPVPPAPAYPYGYPPQTYYVPGQTTYIPQSQMPWVAPMAITTLPQVVTTPGAYPYGGYNPYDYGWRSRRTESHAGITYRRNGVSFSVGGSTQTRN